MGICVSALLLHMIPHLILMMMILLKGFCEAHIGYIRRSLNGKTKTGRANHFAPITKQHLLSRSLTRFMARRWRPQDIGAPGIRWRDEFWAWHFFHLNLARFSISLKKCRVKRSLADMKAFMQIYLYFGSLFFQGSGLSLVCCWAP